MTPPARPPRLVSSRNRRQTLYARALRLNFVNPGGALCFVFFEGTIALAVLLALAEQLSGWAIIVLPVAVALMVKFNDIVAGVLIRAIVPAPRVVGRAKAPAEVRWSIAPDIAPETLSLSDVGAPAGPRSADATTRQSAARRYYR